MSMHNQDTRLELVALSGDMSVLVNSREAIERASEDPALAQRLAALQVRQREVIEAAVASAQAPPPKPPKKHGGMEHITPEEFRRRVQVRRRMDALRKKTGGKS